MRNPHLLARLLLRFERDGKDDDTPHNLSAAALEGGAHLWVASDERGFLERLSSGEPRIFERHQRFILVVYDTPAEERLYEEHGVLADVFRIPS